MIHLLATVGFGPVVLAQGVWARRRTPKLPEAAGPRSGTSGQGPPLQVLILGDSAAAGVGADHQDQALSGQLVLALAPRFETTWRLEAKTGDRTSHALARVRNMEESRFDYVVTSLGVNDLVASMTIPAWKEAQRRLRRTIRDRLGQPRQIISGLPPVSGFPALPQPLRWYLGRRARELDQVLAEDLAGEPDAVHLPLDFALDPAHMAVDGFHPGPEVYRQWAGKVQSVILKDRNDPGGKP